MKYAERVMAERNLLQHALRIMGRVDIIEFVAEAVKSDKQIMMEELAKVVQQR